MEPIIELESVARMYRLGDEKLYALHDVSLAISQGEWVAIVGPSGSGKSTFANLVGGLDKPTSGTIRIDGQDIAGLRDRAMSDYRNRQIGFVFQSFNLQNDATALGNVTLPLLFAGVPARARRKRALACLRAVGLADRVRHRPGQLSGGQRQRVAIARALVNNPKIIIADEPTGNLDSKHGAEIMDLLRSLNEQGITLIVITHDMHIARQANRIIEIRDGTIQTGKRHAR